MLPNPNYSRRLLRPLLLVAALAVLVFSALHWYRSTTTLSADLISDRAVQGHPSSFPQVSHFPPKSYALPAASTPAEHQAQARFAQSIYCDRFYPLPPSTTTLRYVALKLDGFHPDKSRRPAVADIGMYVVGSGDLDIVSGSIADMGTWEKEIPMTVLEALAEAERVGARDPLFLDIGSNLGMHSVAVLAYGYRVMSIDALTMNGHHFMSTLCRHPQLMEKSTFIMNGLGATSTTCALVSDERNIGDGTVTCDPADIALYKTTPHPPAGGKYPLRQWLRIDPLDTFIDEDVWVVKMDVEGFELDVLRGASNFFTRRRVHFLIAEVMGTLPKSKEMVAMLGKFGFSCSEEEGGWYGRRMAIPDEAAGVVLRNANFNIWCIHRENLRSAGLGDKVAMALAKVK
ncbi:S-adenosyl-L-methionine-dependent methyltransferase [Zopfochytrium polystomum]|nr:S-adenosyl-L-methionine-dependent methyltransferase [Zopfochytrium polystomum]